MHLEHSYDETKLGELEMPWTCAESRLRRFEYVWRRDAEYIRTGMLRMEVPGMRETGKQNRIGCDDSGHTAGEGNTQKTGEDGHRRSAVASPNGSSCRMIKRKLIMRLAMYRCIEKWLCNAVM